jgi:hypothetical protein
MLDRAYQQNLIELLRQLPCRIVIPSAWGDYFSKHGPQQASAEHQRRWGRMFYRKKALLELSASLPSVPRNPEQHVVLMRDISRSGAGFLHVEQLFPGEVVRLSLETGMKLAHVSRCVRHNERCFEAGVEFCAGPPA